METRESRYDLIRSIAIILIVCIHSTGMLSGAAPVGWSPLRVEYALFGSIVCPGVHLFILLSGALLLGKEEPIGVFYRKRLRRILIPFLLWSVAVYILTGLTTEGFPWGFLDYFRRLATNGIHGTYWFIYMILGLYLITPLLRWICRTKVGCTTLLLASIAVCGVNLAFPSLPQVAYISCLVDYVAGFWIVRNLQRSKPVILIAAVVLVLSFLGEFFLRLLTENKSTFEMLIAASIFVFIVNSPRAPRLSPAFRLLGDCSLGIYLSHCIFVSGFTQAANQLGLSAAAGPFVIAAGVLAAEWILMYLLRKLRLDRILA